MWAGFLHKFGVMMELHPVLPSASLEGVILVVGEQYPLPPYQTSLDVMVDVVWVGTWAGDYEICLLQSQRTVLPRWNRTRTRSSLSFQVSRLAPHACIAWPK